MATPHPSPDGQHRPSPRGRVVVTTFNVVGVSALVLAPVAALSLWLLLTDPIAASAVVERGDVLPLARSLFVAVGHALVRLLAYL
jgi:hypothetical protein